MRASMLTSARFGTFFKVSRSEVSRLAIISGRVAFLAPEIGMAPVSGLPPTMLMRSMDEAPFVIFSATRARRDNCDGSAAWPLDVTSRLAGGPLIAACARADARLLLAFAQVGAQLLGEPLAAALR